MAQPLSPGTTTAAAAAAPLGIMPRSSPTAWRYPDNTCDTLVNEYLADVRQAEPEETLPRRESGRLRIATWNLYKYDLRPVTNPLAVVLGVVRALGADIVALLQVTTPAGRQQEVAEAIAASVAADGYRLADAGGPAVCAYSAPDESTVAGNPLHFVDLVLVRDATVNVRKVTSLRLPLPGYESVDPSQGDVACAGRFADVGCAIRLLVRPRDRTDATLVLYAVNLGVGNWSGETAFQHTSQVLKHIRDNVDELGAVIAGTINTTPVGVYNEVQINAMCEAGLLSAEDEDGDTKCPTDVATYAATLLRVGFESAFAAAGEDEPLFTSWRATNTDWIAVPKLWYPPGRQDREPVVRGAWVVRSDVSLHLPLVADLDMGRLAAVQALAPPPAPPTPKPAPTPPIKPVPTAPIKPAPTPPAKPAPTPPFKPVPIPPAKPAPIPLPIQPAPVTPTAAQPVSAAVLFAGPGATELVPPPSGVPRYFRYAP